MQCHAAIDTHTVGDDMICYTAKHCETMNLRLTGIHNRLSVVNNEL